MSTRCRRCLFQLLLVGFEQVSRLGNAANKDLRVLPRCAAAAHSPPILCSCHCFSSARAHHNIPPYQLRTAAEHELQHRRHQSVLLMHIKFHSGSSCRHYSVFHFFCLASGSIAMVWLLLSTLTDVCFTVPQLIFFHKNTLSPPSFPGQKCHNGFAVAHLRNFALGH